VETEIRFQGEPINQEFTLDSPCAVHHREPGTEIVVGYPRELRPRFGFYNRGLTLLEGGGEFFRREAVMVNSRYLEHTLARDDVRQDEGFDKVMGMVERLIRRDLPRRLLEMLAPASEGKTEGPDLEFLLRNLARCLQSEFTWTYAARDMQHGGGHQEGLDWVATHGEDRMTSAIHLVYGPYTDEIPAGTYTARWLIALTRAHASGMRRALTLDVYDAKSDTVLAERRVSIAKLGDEGGLQPLELKFRCQDGQVLEFRTQWHENASVRIRNVSVLAGDPVDFPRARLDSLTLFRTPAGKRVGIGHVRQALHRGDLFTTTIDSPVVGALEAEGNLVLEAEPGTAYWAVLEALGGTPPREVHATYCMPQGGTKAEKETWWPLRTAVVRLLRAHQAGVVNATLAHFDYPGSPIADWVAILQHRPGELSRMDEVSRLDGLAGDHHTLVVNADHTTVARLLNMARAEPELAAYLLVKLFLLRGELGPVIDSGLAAVSWEHRCQRLRA
jgi:hypothetical protein